MGAQRRTRFKASTAELVSFLEERKNRHAFYSTDAYASSLFILDRFKEVLKIEPFLASEFDAALVAEDSNWRASTSEDAGAELNIVTHPLLSQIFSRVGLFLQRRVGSGLESCARALHDSYSADKCSSTPISFDRPVELHALPTLLKLDALHRLLEEVIQKDNSQLVDEFYPADSLRVSASGLKDSLGNAYFVFSHHRCWVRRAPVGKPQKKRQKVDEPVASSDVLPAEDLIGRQWAEAYRLAVRNRPASWLLVAEGKDEWVRLISLLCDKAGETELGDLLQEANEREGARQDELERELRQRAISERERLLREDRAALVQEGVVRSSTRLQERAVQMKEAAERRAAEERELENMERVWCGRKPLAGRIEVAPTTNPRVTAEDRSKAREDRAARRAALVAEQRLKQEIAASQGGGDDDSMIDCSQGEFIFEEVPADDDALLDDEKPPDAEQQYTADVSVERNGDSYKEEPIAQHPDEADADFGGSGYSHGCDATNGGCITSEDDDRWVNGAVERWASSKHPSDPPNNGIYEAGGNGYQQDTATANGNAATTTATTTSFH